METRKVKEMKTLSIRTRTAVSALPQVMGECYGEIARYMGSKGIQFAGPPFALYHNTDMNDLDVEIGFPTARTEEGEGRIKPGEIPAGKAAVTLYTGPYDGIEKAYRELTEYTEKEKLRVGPSVYEVYLNDPEETPPAKLQTEIYFPLEGE